MKDYPYIAQFKNDDRFVALFTSLNSACKLKATKDIWEGFEFYEYVNGWREGAFKNITTEYLANTYGEVKSKAHAEFIVKLAENHGYTLTGEVDKSNARTFVIDGENKLLFFMRGSSSFGGSTVKKITIPLPPESNVNTPEEDFEMKQIEKNNGDNLMFGGADKCEEWPCVNDEVMFNDLLQHYDQYKEDYCGKPSKVIARFNTTEGEFITVHREYCAVMTVRIDRVLKDGALIKPKTPEEEFIDDLTHLFRTKDDYLHIADELLSKYNITKKPQ